MQTVVTHGKLLLSSESWTAIGIFGWPFFKLNIRLTKFSAGPAGQSFTGRRTSGASVRSSWSASR